MKRRNICSVNTAGVAGAILLAFQLGLINFYSDDEQESSFIETGDALYYGRDKIGVHYKEYAKSAVYKLVLKPSEKEISECDGSSYKLHNVGGLPRRKVSLMQALGDTNIRALTAVLDDRVSERNVIRILAAGLHPGPGDGVFCHYKCHGGAAEFCSSPAHAMILLAGNHTDYDSDWERKSLMNVISLACAVRYDDNPREVSISSTNCGFSHNVLDVRALNVTRGTMVPSREIGICVRAFDQKYLDDSGITTQKFALWIEYLRRIRADMIHVYASNLNKDFERVVKFYTKETFTILEYTDWKAVHEELETVVSEEAAINHCIQTHLTAYENVIVLSLKDWPSLSGRFPDLKQLVRHQSFKSTAAVTGGFRIQSPNQSKQCYIARPRMILGSAANHFIALTGEPRFKILDESNLVMLYYKDRRLSAAFRDAERNLLDLISKKNIMLES